MDGHAADRTGALTGNQFIADLGPRYPLYLSLLPAAAQKALGQPHDDGRPAFEMLITEGFHAGDYVDIFDGGPTVVADINSVKTIREAMQVEMAGVTESGVRSLVAVGTGASFRVARGGVDVDGRVDPALAEALRVQIGDSMRVVSACLTI